MDIEKEKDLYLAKLLEQECLTHEELEDIVFKVEINAFHSSYLSSRFIDNINFGWSAWQAAKAQAVPEGFVLVPREPTDAMLQIGNKQLSAYYAYKAMIEAAEKEVIEAREQGHD